jgi:Cupin domain
MDAHRPVDIAEADPELAFHEFVAFNNGHFAVFRTSGAGAGPRTTHPDTDELRFALQSAVTIELFDSGGNELVPLTAGSLIVVPRGRWHRHVDSDNLVELYPLQERAFHPTIRPACPSKTPIIPGRRVHYSSPARRRSRPSGNRVADRSARPADRPKQSALATATAVMIRRGGWAVRCDRPLAAGLCDVDTVVVEVGRLRRVSAHGRSGARTAAQTRPGVSPSGPMRSARRRRRSASVMGPIAVD